MTARDKEKCINKIFNQFIDFLKDEKIDIKDIKEEFNKELKAQFKSNFSENGKNLDSILKKFMLKAITGNKNENFRKYYKTFIANHFIESAKNKDVNIDPDVLKIIFEDNYFIDINKDIRNGTGKTIYRLILENEKIPMEKRKEYLIKLLNIYIEDTKDKGFLYFDELYKEEINEELTSQEKLLTPDGDKIDKLCNKISDNISGNETDEVKKIFDEVIYNKYDYELSVNNNRKSRALNLIIRNNIDDLMCRENLFKDLLGENSLSMEEKNKYVKQILNAFFKRCKKEGVYIDDFKNKLNTMLKEQKIPLTSEQGKRLDLLMILIEERITQTKMLQNF